MADSRAFKYFISEEGDLQVYGNGKLYEYQNDQLVALTELTESTLLLLAAAFQDNLKE